MPLDACSIEQLQGELRDGQHDAAGWQLNVLDGLVLLRDREVRREVLLRAKGGYAGIKAAVQKDAIHGRMGNNKYGKPLWDWCATLCHHTRIAAPAAVPVHLLA